MDKKVLSEYIDAVELIRETEADIRRLNKKKKTIVQTNVKGSNREFPYNPQSIHVEGTPFTYAEDRLLRIEEKLLQERKADAEKLKLQAEAVVNHATPRMQRIIRFKCFKRMSWEQVADRMGGGATGESLRKEFERFLVEI